MNSEKSSKATVPKPDGFDSVRDELVGSFDSQIANTLESLPNEYLDSIPADIQKTLIKAVLAARICDIQQEVIMRQGTGRHKTVTVVSRENYAGYLADLIRRLPDEGDLVSAKIFSTVDKEFVLDVFEFGQHADEITKRDLTSSEDSLAKQIAQQHNVSLSEAQSFLNCFRADSELLLSPEEVTSQFQAVNQRRHPNEINIVWSTRLAGPTLAAIDNQPTRFAKVVVSSGNTTTRDVFTRAAEFFGLYQIDIEQAYCENIRFGPSDQVAVLTFLVAIESQAFEQARNQVGDDCSNLLDGDVLKNRLQSFLQVDSEVVAERPTLQKSLVSFFGDLALAELFYVFARLVQISCRNQLSREHVIRRLLTHNQATRFLLEQFKERFANRDQDFPLHADREFNFDSISDAGDKEIFQKFGELVNGIDRCNLHLLQRRGLAMRIPGHLVVSEDQSDVPHTVFYVYGSGFDGFHVRFRDVARGGLRIVRTRNPEHHHFESSRAFDEVFRLALAQQLKNKDIAEGGAKGLIVLQPGADPTRAGQDFVDAILDLLVEGPSVSSPTCTGPSEGEYLYFGPDENVSNDLIDWIVLRAEQRGYPFPHSIMSSKPSIGINHKEFGVTSEGVVVFLDEALRRSQLKSDQPFTVKLTGGPDGDVGGNAIKILIREYGKNARIVAIADGTGAAHDPEGLDHQELTRLVSDGLGISSFNTKRLTANGRVARLENEEEIAWRNGLHFSISSDVFVPAGGRPSAINSNNWRDFLDDKGQPKSKIIVEGANLFITEQARELLSGQGVVIVKDSSANKCGVICSSLEIISSMLLSESEIVAIRGTFIDETIQLLRELARIEAISLFNEQERSPNSSLPEISVWISRQIIRVADVASTVYEKWSLEERKIADSLIESYLPDSLVAKVGDQVADRIPPVYRKQLISAILSSRIVYREGCRNLEYMTDQLLASVIHRETHYEQEVRRMIASLDKVEVSDRERIISILRHAGTRTQRELNL